MYRESLLATALSAALEEVAPNLNEGQREHIWRVFDATMEECLSEAPMMTRVQVHAAPGLDSASPSAPPQLITLDNETSSPELLGGRAAVSQDAQQVFPVYRCVDGVWTILLKDPQVAVRDEFGQEETFQLDYLRVYLREANTPGPGSGRNAAPGYPPARHSTMMRDLSPPMALLQHNSNNNKPTATDEKKKPLL
eukprot:gene4989-3584_t